MLSGICFSTANAMVTAGLRLALLEPAAQKTPTNTAIAQPKQMTIQPLLLPFVLARTTLLTTVWPRKTRSAVPIISPLKGVILQILWMLEDPADNYLPAPGNK